MDMLNMSIKREKVDRIHAENAVKNKKYLERHVLGVVEQGTRSLLVLNRVRKRRVIIVIRCNTRQRRVRCLHPSRRFDSHRVFIVKERGIWRRSVQRTRWVCIRKEEVVGIVNPFGI